MSAATSRTRSMCRRQPPPPMTRAASDGQIVRSGARWRVSTSITASARARLSPSLTSPHHGAPRSPSASFAAWTRCLADRNPSSSPDRWAAATARRAAISASTSSVRRAGGIDGSVARQRRPSTVIQRGASSIVSHIPSDAPATHLGHRPGGWLGVLESRVRGSNPPPHDYKSSALPTELTRRGLGTRRRTPPSKQRTGRPGQRPNLRRKSMPADSWPTSARARRSTRLPARERRQTSVLLRQTSRSPSGGAKVTSPVAIAPPKLVRAAPPPPVCRASMRSHRTPAR